MGIDHTNQFICGDCMKVLPKLKDGCVDFALTSPPYADQIKNYGASAKKFKPGEYLDWFLPISREIYRVLKPTGSFVLNINDKVDGAFQSLYVFQLVIALCEEVGFHLVRDYIWYNPATPPNVFSRGNMGRTKKSHEYCFWFSKSEEWTFNMGPIRKPYSKDMERLLRGNGKGNRSDNTRPSRHNFDLSHAWNDKGGSDPGSVIVLSNTASNDKFQRICKEKGIRHPARFPQKLAEFFILAGTNPGNIVLDPFCGSGTTAVVAEKNDRRWICIDINEDYCNLAREIIREMREDVERDGMTEREEQLRIGGFE